MFIKVEFAVATFVTVPVPALALTRAAKLAIVKLFVGLLSSATEVPNNKSEVVGVASTG